MTIKVAVAKETRKNEHRVALVPEFVDRLLVLGLQVVVEAGAGINAGFSDQAYRDQRAVIAEDKSALYREADIVLWVKRPLIDIERRLPIPSGAIVVGFLDAFKPGDHLQYFARQGLTTFSWDLLPHTKETQPMNASAAMGRDAGKVACRNALELARLKTPRLERLTLLLIGSGNAGIAAAQQACQLGCKVIVASTRGSSRRYFEHDLASTFVLLPQGAGRSMPLNTEQQRRMLRQVISRQKPDVIITTARRFGQRPPVLITETEFEVMKAGTVIEDLTATTGGNTTFSMADEAVEVKRGILVRNVANYPSQEPKGASESYSRCVWNVIRHIALQRRKEPGYALVRDPLLGPAVATFQGRLGSTLLQRLDGFEYREENLSSQ